MKVSRLKAKNFRSLRDVSIELSDLNLFIGANASGKSTILDALRFLHEGVQGRNFALPILYRGGIANVVWNGEEAGNVELAVEMEDEGKRFEWTVRLLIAGQNFHVEERIGELDPTSGPRSLLEAEAGEGWWWSPGEKVKLKQGPLECALAAASADASFPARHVAEFVGSWGFFDPSPVLLRQESVVSGSTRLDSNGRNLGETLHNLNTFSPEILNRIVEATRSIVGIPSELVPQEWRGRFYFHQVEPGSEAYIPQMNVSSGTLRVLALMVAFYGESSTALIGIEEPENYIHPAALDSLVKHMWHARGRVQLMVTTHSPLLLDFLNEPAAVSIVKRHPEEGTRVVKESNPESVQQALEASGFGLGQYYETRGFGS